jgi:hypothetical protein
MNSRPFHVIPSQPITREEARARLMALDPGSINASKLAREWGWSRAKVRRFIAACRAEGVIPPAPMSQAGTSPASPASPSPPQQGESAMSPREITYLRDVPRDVPPFPGDTENENINRGPGGSGGPPQGGLDYGASSPLPPEGPAWNRLPSADRALGFMLGALGITLGSIGLVLNTTYAHSFGRTALAATLLAALGAVIDACVMLLPTVAGNLRAQGKKGPAMTAWGCWAGALIMMLLAASGFAASNIGDSNAAREKVERERTSLTATLDNLQRDRKAITEARAVGTIGAAIQQEQTRIPASIWKATSGCTTGAARACGGIMKFRADKASAERRDQLDKDIKSAASSLHDLPAYAGADPGADMAAKLLSAATLGVIRVTPEAIQQVRIAGLTLAPAASGLLLLFASLIWRGRREDDEPLPSLV